MIDTRSASATPPAKPAVAVNAYQTLQIAPSATYELIEQAYWVLITRARSDRSGEVRLGQLNDAYASLINPDRRTAHDLEHGLTKLRTRPRIEAPRRPMFARVPRYTTRLTHYQLLDLDPGASPEIVDLAYAHRRTRLKGGDARTVYERALVEEAYRTLSDPERRAVYNERVMGIRPAGASQPEQPAEAEQPLTAVEDAPQPAEGARPPVAVDDGHPAGAVAPAELGAKTSLAQKLGLAAVTQRILSRAPSQTDERDRQAAARAALAAEAAAEHQRLAALGVTAEPPPAVAAAEDDLPASGVRTCFRFVGGPQTGEVINLTENSIILGASDAADVRLANPDGMIGAGHVRVWRRDDEFILHQLDSFSTTYVNGERLDLRLAILEPGDEIRIGPHTLVFDQSRA